MDPTWELPAAVVEQAADPLQTPAAWVPPPPVAPMPTQEVPSLDAWQGPTESQPSPDAWTPSPAATLTSANQAAPANGSETKQAATVEPTPEPVPVVQAAPPAASDPTQEDAKWPTWLPRNERSEAVVEDVPVRIEPGTEQAPAGSRTHPATSVLDANRRLITYGGLGILVLIALFVVFQVFSQWNLLGSGGAAVPDIGPTGTQFVQANGFLNTLSPSLDSIATRVKSIPADCGGTHSVTCQSSIEYADASVVKAIDVIDRGAFPGCLAPSLVQVRRDLANLDQALKTALIGFRANTDALVTRGLADVEAASPPLNADGSALTAVARSACPNAP